MKKAVVCTTTFPAREAADDFLKAAMHTQLVACVQIQPVESVYVWKGEVCHETEVSLKMKTADYCVGVLETLLKSMHPYEVPEFTVTEIIGGSEEYLQWIFECVAPENAG